MSARSVAASVVDPELPFLTIEDLGVLRSVAENPDGSVTVTITPTYTGCPATDAIAADVAAALAGAGYVDVDVRTVLDPPWSTDRLSPEGRLKLAEAGIAPPNPSRSAEEPVPVRLVSFVAIGVRCPGCGSEDTEERSHFGATACRSLWWCRACRAPFEHMKPL